MSSERERLARLLYEAWQTGAQMGGTWDTVRWKDPWLAMADAVLADQRAREGPTWTSTPHGLAQHNQSASSNERKEIPLMDRYIGTKIILAEPLEKDGRKGYRVIYEDGYQSWSPVAAFERAYRRVTDAELALLANPDPPRAG